jgi:outer membrane protein
MSLNNVVSGVLLVSALILSSVVQAKDAGDILVRLRGIAVVPDEDGTTDVLGGDIEVDNAYMPELDFTYFFTKNIAAELILATTEHDVKLKSPDVDLGSVWLLPPTLTLQYHFLPDGKFSPYIGAGINYTIFYDEDSGAVNSIDYDDSFGFALQVGVDYKIDDRWSLNADVKKLYLETDVSVNGGAIKSEVDLDPWIFGLGVGYRF